MDRIKNNKKKESGMSQKPVFFLNGESHVEKKLFPHQKDAVDKLWAYYKGDGYKEELGWKPHVLVMPTGAGKTFTANSLIIPHMLEKGYKVLWLAHRVMLLDQAAEGMKEDFFEGCDIDDTPNRPARIISGSKAHLSTASFEVDGVIISSIQSLYLGRKRLPFILKGVKGNKLVVVIDEAHHTPSNSYITVLNTIKKQIPGFKLLGLTATPTRMTESERKMLWHIYDEKYYQPTDLNKLQTQGFLSKAIPVSIKTEIEFETAMTNQDKKHTQRFNELSERMRKQIANSKERNFKIIDTYFDDKEKYGQTIMFALNQIHCQTLARDLNQEAAKRGVKDFKADYVIAGDTGRTEKVIQDYKDGKLDVIVNVQILTEGSDVPSTKSVFLTRPTNSETMLTQMVGRALRGARVGGTEDAYIVDFEDQWRKLKWGKFNEDEEGEEAGKKTKDGPPPPPKSSVPWWLINAYYEAINMDISGFKRAILDFRPVGWYSIGHTNDSDSSRLMVYENQYDGYQQLKENLDEIKREDTTPKSVLDSYFFDINDPKPQLEDLYDLIEVVRSQDEMPPWFTFDERDDFNPRQIAEEIIEKDMGERAKVKFLTDIYTDEKKPIVSQLYSEFDELQNEVQGVINNILNRAKGEEQTLDEAEAKPEPIRTTSSKREDIKAIKKAEKLEPLPLGILDSLVEEVSEMMFKGEPVKPETITWSSKPQKNCWGWFRESDKVIRINKLLNNKMLSRDTLKYIIYHELLHCQGNMSHNKQFYNELHKYPDWQEIEHKLSKIDEEYHLRIPTNNSI